jgi:hypothetical protein
MKKMADYSKKCMSTGRGFGLPAGELMVFVISEFLWSNGVMQKPKQKNLGIFYFSTQCSNTSGRTF